MYYSSICIFICIIYIGYVTRFVEGVCGDNQFEHTTGACLTCHCKVTATCNNGTGACSDGACHDDYFGDGCQSMRPLLNVPPTLDGNNCTGVFLKWRAFNTTLDNGTSPIGRYTVFYRIKGTTWVKAAGLGTPVSGTTFYSYKHDSHRYDSIYDYVVRADYQHPVYGYFESGNNQTFTCCPLLNVQPSCIAPTAAPVTTPTQAPLVPSNVRLTPAAQQITVSWTAGSQPGYLLKIVYKEIFIGDCQAITGATPVTTTRNYADGSFVLANLKSWTKYQVHISLVDASQREGNAVTQEVLTLEKAPTGSVVSITVASKTTSTVTFTWTEVPCNGRFGVLKNYVARVLLGSATVGTPQTVTARQATITGLQPSTTYTISVVYVNAVGSGPAKTVTFVTLTPITNQPTGFHLQQRALTSATLAWTAPTSTSGTVTQYVVRYWLSTQAESTALEKATGSTVTTIALTGLQSKLQYTAKVYADVSGTRGAASDPLTFTTQYLEMTARTHTSLSISWGLPTSNKAVSNYKVTTSLVTSQATPRPSYATNTITASVRNTVLSGLPSATQFSVSVAATFTDNTNDTPLALSYWTISAPFPQGTVTPPTISDITETTALVYLAPVTNYNGGPISEYYVSIEKLNSRRKRAVITNPALLGVPGSLVYTSPNDGSSARTFTLGNGTASAPFANPALVPGTKYRAHLAVTSPVDGNLVTGTASKDFVTKGTAPAAASGGTNWGLIGGLIAFFLILIVLVILLILFILWQRKHGQHKRPLPPPYANGHTPHVDTGIVPKSHKHWSEIDDINVARYVILDLEYGQRDLNVETIRRNPRHAGVPFEKEFHSLPQGLCSPATSAARAENAVKNRNPNILAYDHSRVSLQPVVPGQNNYINANYVDGYIRRRAYIASQSPFDGNTARDFWTMIYQQNVAQVVMLTEALEEATVKSSQYWPEYDPTSGSRNKEYHGPFCVRSTGVETYPYFTLRTFELTNEEKPGPEVQRVTHYQFHGWPENGVPASPLQLIDLYSLVKMQHQMHYGPMVVHCGTGISRTAVFIALDSLLQQAVHEDVVNVFRFCTKMRKARPGMVRSARQYMFIYDCLFDALLASNNIVNLDVRDTYQQLASKNPKTKQTYLWEQHCVLEKYTIRPLLQNCRVANDFVNKPVNRVFSIVPPDEHRVRLRHGGRDYINAVWLDGANLANDIILTQTPMSETLGDFWRLIEQEGVTCIIDMQPGCHGVDNAVTYWPDGSHGSSSEVVYGSSVSVRCRRSVEVEGGEVMMQELRVRPYSSSGVVEHGMERTVRIYQLIVPWDQYAKIPAARLAVVNLVNLMLTERESGPLLVHCLDGASRSGLFAASYVCVSRLSRDHFIDVFHTVKAMKMRRPQLVAHLEQYKFIFKLLWDWVRSFMWKELNTEMSTGTLLGHLGQTDLESIYTHVQSPVLHAHVNPGGDTLTGNTGHNLPILGYESGTIPIHYRYAGDELIRNKV